jgi:alkaline phosphatase
MGVVRHRVRYGRRGSFSGSSILSFITQLVATSTVLALTTGCSGSAAPPSLGADQPSDNTLTRETATQSTPTRLVLFIADGAGVGYWSALTSTSRAPAVERFPVVGLMRSGNTSSNRPESASAATALALGMRTFYSGIGVGPDSLPRPSVIDFAQDAGLATGIVTTARLIDATPAAFASHSSDRHAYPEIANQMANHGIEVLLGDGQGVLEADPRFGDRYTLITNPSRLRELPLDTLSNVLGLFNTLNATASSRDPSLATMTAAALQILDRDPDGFFLLVETEQTDERGHDNAPLEVIVAEMVHFDQAIRTALDYQAAHPETLIVVAADHETGGFAVFPDEEDTLTGGYTTEGHTAELVPIFATGPGAEAFGGVQTDAEIGQHLIEHVRPR